MFRLVCFLFLTLLFSVQAARAGRLPEMQTAEPQEADAAALNVRKDSPESAEAAAPPPSLAADAGQKTVLTAEQKGETPPAPRADHAPDAASPPQPAAAQATPDNAGRPQDNANAGITKPGNAGQGKTDKDTAAAIISGTRRLGIIEHQIVRAYRGNQPDINLSYPSVGMRAVDASIRNWATGIADAFEETFAAPGLYPDEGRPIPELWSSYTLSHPSDNALSITFEVWTYVGDSQGNLDVITLNFNMLTGQRLGLVDIFEDPDAALAIMSAWSRKILTPRLGGMRQQQMLRTGLTPVPENFASLTLIPSGIRINFQPYQVAPGMAGAQKVDIPLEELLPEHPLLLLWGK